MGALINSIKSKQSQNTGQSQEIPPILNFHVNGGPVEEKYGPQKIALPIKRGANPPSAHIGKREQTGLHTKKGNPCKIAFASE